jgi:hypothetical protein
LLRAKHFSVFNLLGLLVDKLSGGHYFFKNEIVIYKNNKNKVLHVLRIRVFSASTRLRGSTRKLIYLPLRCPSVSATIACPGHCHCWLPTLLPLLLWPQTAAPCSFPHNQCLLIQPLFSVVMFKILHSRPIKNFNIFAATLWLIVVCPCAASAFATVACTCRFVFTSLLVVVPTCAASTANYLSSTMMVGGAATHPLAPLLRTTTTTKTTANSWPQRKWGVLATSD